MLATNNVIHTHIKSQRKQPDSAYYALTCFDIGKTVLLIQLALLVLRVSLLLLQDFTCTVS